MQNKWFIEDVSRPTATGFLRGSGYTSKKKLIFDFNVDISKRFMSAMKSSYLPREFYGLLSWRIVNIKTLYSCHVFAILNKQNFDLVLSTLDPQDLIKLREIPEIKSLMKSST
jgi:hypothetical protein